MDVVAVTESLQFRITETDELFILDMLMELVMDMEPLLFDLLLSLTD
jgi:hypothetical protein